MKAINAVKSKAIEAKETLVEMSHVSVEMCWFAIKCGAAVLATASICWVIVRAAAFVLGVPVAN